MKNDNKQSLTKDILRDYMNEPKRGFTPKITDDPVTNIFIDFKTGFDWEKQNGYEGIPFYEYADEYEKFRLKYDADARYFNETLNDPIAALRGDTITSFYTLYKEMLYHATGAKYHKGNNPFDELIAKRNEPGFKEVNDRFTEFAELLYTAGNFMLLPHREMNVDRYRCSQDRIDKSLYECFPGGELSKYFGISEEMQMDNLIGWIKAQSLEMMFENGEIERDKIIPFNKNDPFIEFNSMTIEGLNEFLDSVVWLIKQRNDIITL